MKSVLSILPELDSFWITKGEKRVQVKPKIASDPFFTTAVRTSLDYPEFYSRLSKLIRDDSKELDALESTAERLVTLRPSKERNQDLNEARATNGSTSSSDRTEQDRYLS